MSVSGLVCVASGASRLEAKVAGLPLVLRAVFVLKKEGMAPVSVLADIADAPHVRDLLRTRGLDDVQIVHDVPNDGPAVVLPHDVVCDPAVIRALRDAPFPAVAARGGTPLGPERTGAANAEARTPIEVGDAFVERVAEPASEARAIHWLFEACKKPVDGLVSRYLNRHVSIFLSKRIVNTSITPNMTTIATFFVGVLAALAVSRGGYAWTLLGAALLQWNSVLDGVDGELARVRHQHSRLGQWLDTLSDDVVNVLFWAALGVGALGLPHGQFLLQAGLVAAAAHLALAAIYWVELVAIGSGDAYDIDWWFRRSRPAGLGGRVVVAMMYVPKKDFFIFFCLVGALFGVLPYLLPLVAFAVVCSTAAAMVRGAARLARPRGRGTAIAQAGALVSQRAER